MWLIPSLISHEAVCERKEKVSNIKVTAWSLCLLLSVDQFEIKKKKKGDCCGQVRNIIAFCMFVSMVSLQREVWEILVIWKCSINIYQLDDIEHWIAWLVLCHRLPSEGLMLLIQPCCWIVYLYGTTNV